MQGPSGYAAPAGYPPVRQAPGEQPHQAGAPPAPVGYPQQPGAPPSSGGFPQPSTGPPSNTAAFHPSGGFPSAPGGVPQQATAPPASAGLPQQPGAHPAPGGYPPQPSGPPGIPVGYGQPGGYPPVPSGLPQQTGAPPAPGGFHQQPGAPTSGAFPPQASGAPGSYGQPGGYPPVPGGHLQQAGGPPAPGGFPPQVGGPPAPGGFPPQVGGPPAPGGFPPQAGGPPGIPGGYGQAGGFPPVPGGFSQPGFPPGPGGYGQPGGFPPGPGGYGQPPRQKLDASSLPSAVQVIEDDRQTRSGVFPTGFPNAEYPPLTTTEFFAHDNGNSNPKFIRSSYYSVPTSNDIVKQTSIPFVVGITPFAQLSANEYEPPVVDLGELGPVRCSRCKAYICPFMDFIDGGRKFRCPFCHTASAVEETYFAHLDHVGRRTDIQHRQELYLGSYEFVATKPYCKNNIPPKQPAYIFFLDVSYNAVRTGLVDTFCKQIPYLLKELPKDVNQDVSSMRVGFATYDQTIHFYNLSNPHKAEMLIAHDVSDIFVPLIDGFLVNFNEAEEALKHCLERVRTCFADTRITETMLGPVIQAGLDAFRNADCAGKMFIFHTSLPNFEAPGKLRNREDRRALGTEKERTQLQPDTDFYTKLGNECIKAGCAVDLFLFPNAHVDLASIAPVCHISGGTIYKYQYFDVERDAPRFLQDLRHDISRKVAFDAMVRVRTSTGIRPTGFYGGFFMQNTTDIEVGAIDSDKGYSVEIKYDDKLGDHPLVLIQVATLFTSCSGQRRLRIHNLALPCSNDYNVIYRLADQDTVVSHYFRMAATNIREKTPKEVREDLITRCAQMLATYRDKCSPNSTHSQLVLPESLKLMPLYISCILRHDAISGGSELTTDDRNWMINLALSVRMDMSLRYLYPQAIPISNLEFSENGTLIWPAPIRASIDYLNNTEAYFIENGIICFIWLGANVSSEFVNDVFNVQTLQHLDTESHILPERDNARSRAVRQLIDHVNVNRPNRLKLYIIRQQDSLESWMKKFLVEDKYAATTISYVDFLCQVHREIRTLLS